MHTRLARRAKLSSCAATCAFIFSLVAERPVFLKCRQREWRRPGERSSATIFHSAYFTRCPGWMDDLRMLVFLWRCDNATQAFLNRFLCHGSHKGCLVAIGRRYTTEIDRGSCCCLCTSKSNLVSHYRGWIILVMLLKM
ncbi:hypothetical protein BOTBODRAFT_349174 [Botryobasidium botryosum FD-172 SS1]|uniref:Uncharacterized protein n=1 Tax=Botryobasidium botryosum (strain FD-172 SS1) TaxID=930990 RepID=A0A067MFR7_BOTB1|nr:hypothetical protein BOTBODRAFT_349174 [Botryobasidium botryosum FD-172 SS1]